MVCSHSSIYVCLDGTTYSYYYYLPPPPPHTERVEGILNLKTDDDDRRPFFVSTCIIESDMAIFNAATCLNLTFSKGIC